MSKKHPIIAVTGSSGSGTTTTRSAFENIFRRQEVRVAVVEGDSFHRYDREEMRREVERARLEGRTVSHFGPAGNLFEELEELFCQYGRNGSGRYRRYLHDDEEADPLGQSPGTFTPWQPIPADTDLLFYEGLHGGLLTEKINLRHHVDLLVGVVPIINLEWLQKAHRDTRERGYGVEQVMEAISLRIYDYMHYIIPQFTHTDINVQRVPTVDTSNPFIARDIPTADESFVVIRFRRPREVDFPYLLAMIHDSFMSRRNSIVVPGGKLGLAMELIFGPLIERLLKRRG
ncbi:MAG: phosphoribulokinase [Candidatus Competibacteraceae bacterium]|nr:phosphoribulokinase [Candidatus Competibacteraceae bacterium]